FGKDVTKFPVFGTIANQFNDAGTNALFAALIDSLNERYNWSETIDFKRHVIAEKQNTIIPNNRSYYLQEISQTIRNYHQRTEKQSKIARKLYQLTGSKQLVNDQTAKQSLGKSIDFYQTKLTAENESMLKSWAQLKDAYGKDQMTFIVRDQ